MTVPLLCDAQRAAGRARAWAAAALIGGAAFAAHAGLFDDEEARKAIVDLRTRVATADETAKARSAELAAQNAQLTEQLQALRRSLLDLNNQLEAMRGELAKLRGADEQLTRDMAELQRRQKDIAQGLDDRMRRIEPQKVVVDGAEFLADPDEKRMFDEAMAALRGGEFDKSAGAFNNFLRRHPGSGYANPARFWLGNALYGKRDYKEAIAAFRAFVTAAPEHPRAPEAMLALANSQSEMKDTRGARKTIDDLMKAYPGSEAAQAGKERLAALR
jgi:tol-pal system protein YbgF